MRFIVQVERLWLEIIIIHSNLQYGWADDFGHHGNVTSKHIYLVVLGILKLVLVAMNNTVSIIVIGMF